VLLVLALLAVSVTPAVAQQPAPEQGTEANASQPDGRTVQAARFAGGALIALAAHESGHLLFDVLFDADPRLKRVDFHGVPFFAITHRTGLSPRRELTISSAGFWVQHAGSEWILTRDPGIRHQRAPLRKGVLAFNTLTSIAYAGAAFARTGPVERDTRGIADSTRIDERLVGAIVLAPAALDAWRYFDPDARWAVWASRAAKCGMFLLFVR
jgi:hypothetical protein